ncbi:hypothetical protein [Quadrisphaera setariae]|uniref:Uncharacterized protein n=1 Tax=Quadrisphaera setariae TaxID=2593304 RepID=A0A5C8ZE79_9ACTN|nr:hypothetical protein [Quadrisphaera setariae]TXR55488.1 hypothetical protein FMM08_14340 [Quadrisphaera setariae]
MHASDHFTGLDATVADFWRFALGDLRSNTTRGLLAEFLVQRAVGGDGVREEWAKHDVTAADGTTIEVKSAARLQAWPQRRAAVPRFGGLRSRTWTDGVGHTDVATHHAQVYVFCLHTETDPRAYDALDLDQWQFAALSRAVVEAQGCASLAWPTGLRLAGESAHHRDLAEAVAACLQA